jgi:hypothetical protein
MRIPSSFTEDNLYSRHKRRTKGQSPHRRLMRLGLAMILVIAVMRQAGNPRIYEVFFPAIDAPPVSRGPADLTPERMYPAESGRADGEGPTVPRTEYFEDAKLLARLQKMLFVLGDDKNALLMEGLASARAEWSGQAVSSEDQPWPQAWRDQLNAAFLQAADEPEANDRPAPIPALEPPPDWDDSSTVAHLQIALDRWAIARVDPAAVWKGVDALGFYRLLENDPNRIADAVASRTSVTSLVQQPDVYLHRRVVLPASVARVILRPAAKNPFGVSQYWEVWLRPRDGSERPFIAFTSEVSPEIAAIPADTTLADGPMVWIDGVFLKRIAYQSSLGRELAPAIFGKLHEPESSLALPTAASSVSPEGWVLFAVSASIGCSAAAFIFFFSGKGIARSRQLRQKTVPATPQFLAHFDDSRHRSQTGERSS